MSETASGDIEDLRKALQFAVCQIIWDRDRKLGTRTTSTAISALTELTFQYATKSLIPDLYTFSTHANRKSTISTDDVAVVLRKIEPGQLASFKRDFCNGIGGTKTASTKDSSSISGRIRKEWNRKRTDTEASDRRRKRIGTDALSLSSSSSSSEDDSNHNTIRAKKQSNTACHEKLHSNPLRSKAVSSTKATTKGSKNHSESLLGKFRLSAGSNLRRKTFDLDDDSSSTDDEPITGSSLKRAEIRPKATSPAPSAKKLKLDAPLSLARCARIKSPTEGGSIRTNHARKQKPQLLGEEKLINSMKLDRFSHGRKTKKSAKSHQKQNLLIEAGDDGDNLLESSFSSPDTNRERIGSKQSQVEEPLANLSPDSGIDDNDSRDEDHLHLGNRSSSENRRHPVIQSDGDEETAD